MAIFTGTIVPTGDISVPPGFLLCDGNAVSRSTYAGLFAVIGSSGFPLGSTVTTRPTAIATPSAIASSSASWGGSPSSRQQLSASFTPQMKGVIKARVYLAKPGATVYVDPYIGLSNNISNRRQYLLPGYGGMNETAQGEFSYTFAS